MYSLWGDLQLIAGAGVAAELPDGAAAAIALFAAFLDAVAAHLKLDLKLFTLAAIVAGESQPARRILAVALLVARPLRLPARAD